MRSRHSFISNSGSTLPSSTPIGVSRDRTEPDAVNVVAMLDKVAVVGVGAVGQACAFALMLRGSAREIVLVDRAAKRASAVAADMRYGAPLAPTMEITSGDWSDLAGAGVVLICAGANEKGGGATDRAD